MEAPDPTLDFYREKIRATENDIRDLLMERHFSEARFQLQNTTGWKQLVDRLQTLLTGETNKLLYNKLDAYSLGSVQGAIRVLRVVVDTKVLTEEELAALEAQVTILQNQLTEYRNLLE